MNLTKRSTGLDIIRCVALLCVISVHFFLNTEYFYNEIVSGPIMLIMVMMRSAFMICVPLFMMLTGCLVRTKEISLRYYIKLIRVLFVYVMASIFCGLYNKYIRCNGLTFPTMIINIFSFRTAEYSWYIEMYIGLFLLIPFLNIIYDGLTTKQQKQILVITFLFLTALPSMFNTYRIAGLDWWLQPSLSDNYFPVVPAYWTSLYPFTYFYLGRYLRDYPITMKTATKLILGIITFVFAGLYNYYRSYGSSFINGLWNSYGSFLIVLQSVLVFSLLSDLNYGKLPMSAKHIAATISELSLGAYLTSWILDQVVYGKLNQAVPAMGQQLMYFPVTVTIVFLGSLCLSAVIQFLYVPFQKLLQFIPPLRTKVQ